MSDVTEASPIAEADWVARFADEVIAEAGRRKPGQRIVCASGLSPSGPIHLGNQRELMTPHLVADEIKRRGIDGEHIVSFDDYDRFRKVPAGIPAELGRAHRQAAELRPGAARQQLSELGRPLQGTAAGAMARLGIEVRAISQTEMYTSGAYTEQILRAMATPWRDRRDPGQVPDQGPAGQDLAEAVRGRGGGSAGSGRGVRCGGRGRRRTSRRLLPVQAVLLGLRPRHHHCDGLRRRDDRADLHLRVRARRDRDPARSPARQAGLEGRLADALGVRGRRSSSPPASTTARPARRSWSAARSSGRSSAACSRSARCTRSSASPAWRR